MRLEATGRTKPRGKVGNPSRKASRLVEIRCLDCKHVGWSNHVDAERLLNSLPDPKDAHTPGNCIKAGGDVESFADR
jgi:hypothetical protein